jgi:hypothetical protein
MGGITTIMVYGTTTQSGFAIYVFCLDFLKLLDPRANGNFVAPHGSVLVN